MKIKDSKGVDLSDILESPELAKIAMERQVEYADLIDEWWSTGENGDRDPRVLKELKTVCKSICLKSQYKNLIIDEYMERIFYEALIHLDETRSNFRTFFWLTARNKIKDIKKYYGKYEREDMYVTTRSFDETNEDGRTLDETYWDRSKESFEDKTIKSLYGELSDELQGFLNSLSQNAQNILMESMDGKEKKEIMEILHLSENEYNLARQEIRRKRASVDMLNLKQRTLDIKQSNLIKDRTSTDTNNNEETAEQSKEESKMTTKEKNKIIATNVKDYVDDVIRGEIDNKLAIQRPQGFWTTEMEGNLITTVLSGYPFPNIICAEDGQTGEVHILDGGQRTNTLMGFINNNIVINKKSEHLDITFDDPEYDEEGKIKKDENGLGIFHSKTINVGGMKYKDLPAELQRKFCKGQMMIEKYLACTPEEMAWHMRRYNNMKPMTASQKGLTYLGIDMGKNVKDITENSRFFKNFNQYTKLSLKSYMNSDFNRIISESVMAINFLDDWQKKQTDLSTYLRINATKGMFAEINEILDKLIDAGVEEVREMFTAKNSFLWITLYYKFAELGIEDSKFIDFLKDFNESLREKELYSSNLKKNVTYDELDKKASKDTSTVKAKIEYLENLMREYFNIANTPDDDDEIKSDTEDNIEDNVEEETDNGANEENEISTVVNDEVEEVPFEEEVTETVDEKMLKMLEQETVEAEAGPIEEVSNEDIDEEIVSDVVTKKHDDSWMNKPINQPVKDAEWIHKEEDAKNGINPNAEVLRDYVDELYDNDFGRQIREIVGEDVAKKMAIEILVMLSGDKDTSMDNLIEYCKVPFVNSQYQKMKDMVISAKDIDYYVENIKNTVIFENNDNYPILVVLMNYINVHDYSEETVLEWLEELSINFEDFEMNYKTKYDLLKAMCTNLYEYVEDKNTTMVEKKTLNLDF